MAGIELSLTLSDLDVVNAKLAGLPRVTGEILGAVGGIVEDQTRRRFVSKTGPDGTGWPEWSPGYQGGGNSAKAAKRRGKSLLQDTNALLDSIAFELDGDSVSVGSEMVYAAIHQFGGTSDMAAGPAAIPARPFLGLGPDDEAEILEIVTDAFGEVLQ